MSSHNIPYTGHSVQPSTQNVKQSNIEFILPDGIHFDEAIGEHVIVFDGQIVNYAFHWSTAVAQFREASRVRRDHRQRNILNLEGQ